MSKSKKPRNKKMSTAKKERLQQTQSNGYGGNNFNPVTSKVGKTVNPVTTKVF